MKNKKSLIRIVEAVIAIMIVISAALIIIVKQPKKITIEEIISEKQTQLLKVITNNNEMRDEVLLGKTEKINSFISKNIPNTLDFTTNICDIDRLCNENTPNDRDVFASETIITANLTNYPDKKTRKLMFFVWKK